jgi:hypothetical protein
VPSGVSRSSTPLPPRSSRTASEVAKSRASGPVAHGEEGPHEGADALRRVGEPLLGLPRRGARPSPERRPGPGPPRRPAACPAPGDDEVVELASAATRRRPAARGRVEVPRAGALARSGTARLPPPRSAGRAGAVLAAVRRRAAPRLGPAAPRDGDRRARREHRAAPRAARRSRRPGPTTVPVPASRSRTTRCARPRRARRRPRGSSSSRRARRSSPEVAVPGVVVLALGVVVVRG